MSQKVNIDLKYSLTDIGVVNLQYLRGNLDRVELVGAKAANLVEMANYVLTVRFVFQHLILEDSQPVYQSE